MKKYICSCVLVASVAVVSASAQTTSPATGKTPQATPSSTATDTTARGFLTKAAEGGMAEVELGRLASTKATNSEVKAFAQKLVTDHSKANDEVKALAAKKNITLPTSVGAKHKAEHDKLAAMSGAAFDRAYVDAMLADHQKDVAEFKQQSTMNQDADVKAFAARTLPTLEAHLKQVESLSKSVGTKTE